MLNDLHCITNWDWNVVSECRTVSEICFCKVRCRHGWEILMACRDWQIKTFDLIAASKCFSVELAAIIFFLHLHSKSLVRRITWALCLFSLVMPLLDTKNMCFLKLNQMQKCTPGVTACNRGDSRSRSWKWPKTLCMHPVHYTRGVIFKTHTSGIQVNNHNQSRTLRYFFAGTATAYSNLCD